MGQRGPKPNRKLVEACAVFDAGQAIRQARETGADTGKFGSGWALAAFRLRLSDGAPPCAFLAWTPSEGSEEVVSQWVPLVAIASPVGGRRWMAQCHRCGRAVVKLYRPEEADAFACRECHRLTYASRRLPRKRINQRDRELARQLGCKSADVHRAFLVTLLRPHRRPRE